MTFTYTDAHVELDSSFVEAVFYNATTKDAVVVLDSNGWGASDAYRYTSVPPEAVDALVDAYSIGAYYNTNFKTVYGPAVSLGKFYPQDFVQSVSYDSTNVVSLPVDANKDKVTAEYSLQPVFDPTVSGAPLVTDYAPLVEPTKEFGLSLVEDEDDEDADLYVDSTTVHYVLNGKKSKFVCAEDTLDVQDALDELGEIIERLGLSTADVKPTKVVFKFV